MGGGEGGIRESYLSTNLRYSFTQKQDSTQPKALVSVMPLLG